MDQAVHLLVGNEEPRPKEGKTCQDLRSEGSQAGYHLSGKKTKARLVLNEVCVWPTSLGSKYQL